jgi:hypothetical protein
MQKNFYVRMFDRRSNIPLDESFYRLVGPFAGCNVMSPPAATLCRH